MALLRCAADPEAKAGQSGPECALADELWKATRQVLTTEISTTGISGGAREGRKWRALEELARRSPPKAAAVLRLLGLIWVHRTHGSLMSETVLMPSKMRWRVAYEEVQEGQLKQRLEEAPADLQRHFGGEWPRPRAAQVELPRANHLPEDARSKRRDLISGLNELFGHFYPLAATHQGEIRRAFEGLARDATVLGNTVRTIGEAAKAKERFPLQAEWQDRWARQANAYLHKLKGPPPQQGKSK